MTETPNTKCNFSDLSSNPAVLLSLLQQGVLDPASDDNHLLCWACEKGHLALFRYLLNEESVIVTQADNTPLIEAATNGHTEIMALWRNARINSISRKEVNEALVGAVGNLHEDAVVQLLQYDNVDPGGVNEKILGALVTNEETKATNEETKAKQMSMLRLLLKDGRVIPYYDHLHIAMKFDRADLFSLLVTEGKFDPSANEQNLIRDVGWFGSVEVLKLLLADARVDPTANNIEVLRDAANRNHLACVTILFADPRIRDANVCDIFKNYNMSDGMSDGIRALFDRVKLEVQQEKKEKSATPPKAYDINLNITIRTEGDGSGFTVGVMEKSVTIPVTNPAHPNHRNQAIATSVTEHPDMQLTQNYDVGSKVEILNEGNHGSDLWYVKNRKGVTGFVYAPDFERLCTL